MESPESYVTLQNRGGVNRLTGESNIPLEVQHRELQDRPASITKWGRYRIKLDRRRPLDDMPWMMCGNMVASDRLRRFLEKHAPGQLQYLPIATVFRGKPISEEPYWVFKALIILDCIDFSKSIYKLMGNEPYNWFFFERIVFKEEAIPDDVMIFRACHDTTILYIRVELRNKLIEANMTGCQFYPVNYLDDP